MILVVSDNWPNIVAFRNSFSVYRLREDFNYFFVTNYEAAKKFFITNRRNIDVVILDLNEVSNNYNIAKAIRNNYINDSIDVIVRRNEMNSDYNFPFGIRFYFRHEIRDMVGVISGTNAFPHPCIRPCIGP